MLTSYRRVLARPGAALFSGTGLVARMPISMMTLAIVLLVTAQTGSYTLAGQVSAAYVVANAAVSIPHGRLLDRIGQFRVLLGNSVLFPLGCGLLGYSVLHGWPTPWPHLCAVLAGVAIPQIGTSVRARWTYLLRDNDERQTAFAVEAMADETVFMTGPSLVTFLATLWSPVDGLVAAVILGTVGTLGLAAQRSTEPPAHPRSPNRADRVPMPWLALAPVALAAAALGSLFGATEVATVAFAVERGHEGMTGVLLAIWAFGSLLAGLVTGARHWRVSIVTRARVALLGLTLAMLPTPFLANLWSMGLLLLLAGLAISPSLIASISLLEQLAPRQRLSEAMGLLQSGMAAGIAPGAAAAGYVIDRHGASPAYWVAIIGGALAFTAACFARDPVPGRTAPPILQP